MWQFFLANLNYTLSVCFLYHNYGEIACHIIYITSHIECVTYIEMVGFLSKLS